MERITFINASQWLQIQCGSKRIYSPNPAIIDVIQKKQFVTRFWPQTYTAFACIIYDEDLQEIIAVRDHFGLEPSYYSHINGKFIFGSTIPAVLKHIAPSPKINTTQINQLFFNKWFNAETYSDETYYQSVYRLEPGCELKIDLSANSTSSRKTIYWNLKQCTQSIRYADERDYVAHFSWLLAEALIVQIGNQQNVAAEFSGGLDSSAIVAAAFHNNIQPTLYMHVATPGSSIVDDISSARVLIDQLKITNMHYIDAKQFDLVTSMNEYADYFAGGAPYNGFILASNIHRAIAARGHHTVLSGVGGDECVSGHAPLKTCISQIILEKGKRLALREFYQSYQVRDYGLSSQLKRYVQWLKLVYSKSSGSLHEHEYNLLQGPGSHHLRMRVEYNAVLAKFMRFNYVYPLLYPPLVEFCYQLPLEQKRLNGMNRYLIRNYLAQFFSSRLYGKQTKSGSVTPATLEKTQTLYDAGAYKNIFYNLPFQTERNFIQKRGKANKKYPFMHDIPAYMFKAYWDGLTQ